MKSYVETFNKHGFFIGKLNKKELHQLNKIRSNIVKITKNFLKIKKINSEKNFLEKFHKMLDNSKKLNECRLNLFNGINRNNFNLNCYNVFSRFIEPIVGNENVIQKKINLSIQMPNDDSSLLPVHSDTWAGDSPFEVVMWIPLVNCNKTQSMFILPMNSKKYKIFKSKVFKNNNEIMKLIKSDIKFIKIKYGEVLIFSQNLPHGNVTNLENKSRFSLNARIKSLMSPYYKKGLLDFFDIVKLKPATKLGLNYEFPKFK